MSNYPPGVTGNEYEIAGPDSETEEPVECDSNDVPSVPLHLVKTWADRAEDMLRHGDLTMERVSAELDELAELVLQATDTDGYCRFVGKADVTRYGSSAQWVCPACDTIHNDEHDEEQARWDAESEAGDVARKERDL